MEYYIEIRTNKLLLRTMMNFTDIMVCLRNDTKKEYILCHSTNRQNQATVLEVQIMINLREKGKDLMGKRVEGSPGKLAIFSFLILLLITWVCPLCENSSNYTVVIIYSLFYMYAIL